jgi:prevent-host-death family protein
MATVGASEARTHFAQLLERVERGEAIVISRRGKEVARLMPARAWPDRNAAMPCSAAFANVQAGRARQVRGGNGGPAATKGGCKQVASTHAAPSLGGAGGAQTPSCDHVGLVLQWAFQCAHGASMNGCTCCDRS